VISPTLSPAEVQAIAGGYKRPADQLRALREQGFYRARIGKITGQVILERPHYDAVCAGGGQASNDSSRTRPTLRAVK
jgi:hypothetical protein